MKSSSVFRFCLMSVLVLALNSNSQTIGSPKIIEVRRTPTDVNLRWTDAGTNVAYTVQTRENLGESLWLVPLATNSWPITSTNWFEVTPPTNSSRFYRVIAVPSSERGKIISSQAGSLYATNVIALLLSLANVSIAPQYAVQVHRLVYETIDPLGARTVASAALAVPQNVGKPLPLFSYQHGTIARTNDAPSGLQITGEAGIGLAVATGGYVAVLPDYLGLGSSPGLHPYHHARSEATACVDALRAARRWCASNNVPLNKQLFLAGYSQGGHATMALQRELEKYHTNEFTITASAPMAGAYDLSGVTAEDVLSGRPQPNPYYFAYLLAAYQSVYHLASSLSDLLVPPYDSTLPPLFNGNATGDQINQAMPTNAIPIDILKPEFIADFRTNQNNLLRQALRDNDLYAWTPQSPMRMYHCSGDLDVILANSQVAYTNFLARGATQVQLIDPMPGADHGDCAIPALLGAKTWFDSLKQ